MVKVYTAQYRYPGDNRLDITVKGNDPIGKLFAPTWAMVMAHKKSGNDWDYIQEYHKMIIASYSTHPEAWAKILSRDVVILVCFCPAGTFCHRNLVAQYLTQLGAEYCGELVESDGWQVTKKTEDTPIKEFKGEYRWLSNFWKVPIHFQGIDYLSNEHMFQAWKAPADKRAYIATCDKPKAEGRKQKLPEDWDISKNVIMLEGLRIKFSNEALAKKLMATEERELIEGNYWHDNYWGNCTCPKCVNIKGLNNLGKMLMQVREEISK